MKVWLRVPGLLCAGLAVAVIVAWGCALWSGEELREWEEFDSGGSVVEEVRVPGAFELWTPREWRRTTASSDNLLVFEERASGFGRRIHAIDIRTVGASGNWTTMDSAVRIVRCGWPMAALSAVERSSQRVAITGKPAYIVERFGGFAPREFAEAQTRWLAGRERTVPYGVQWSGLLFNSVLYAGVIAVARLGPTAVRSAVRRRRGACPACGYDRSGLAKGAVCPECGGLGG